ncbi:MAG: amidohydrolase family protein [Candidatus Acidiferrum sp.]
MMKRRSLLYVMGVAVLCSFQGLAAQEKPIVILHARIIDGLGGRPIEDGAVILRGRTIEYAGPASGATVPRDAQIIDGKGKSVLPGLADLHVHLQGGWDGISVDLLGYQRYLNAMLYSGITTILDTGNYQPWVLQLRQEVASGHLLGPRIYCTGAMIDAADPAWPDLAYSLTSRAQIPEFVQRDKRANVDLIKGYANLSDRMLRRLVEEAHKEKIRVVIDQWERNGSPDLVRTGIDGFAHAPTRRMPPDDIQLIHDRELFVITTLTVEEYSAHRRLNDLRFLDEPLIAETTPPWFLTELRAEATRTLSEAEKHEVEASVTGFDEMKRNVKKLLDASVLLGAGTDAPYPGVFQGEALHRELELLVEAGMTPLEALRLATFNAARIMHAEQEWGSLQAGRQANVVIVAGNPAERISDTRKIEAVILNGKILDRNSLRFDVKKDLGFRAVTGNFSSPMQ